MQTIHQHETFVPLHQVFVYHMAFILISNRLILILVLIPVPILTYHFQIIHPQNHRVLQPHLCPHHQQPTPLDLFQEAPMVPPVIRQDRLSSHAPHNVVPLVVQYQLEWILWLKDGFNTRMLVC